MKTPIFKFLFSSLIIFIFFQKDILAQSKNTVVAKSITTYAKFHGKTSPLRDIISSENMDSAFKASMKKAIKGDNIPNFPVSKTALYPNMANALPKNGDPVRQQEYNHSPEDVVEPEFVVEGTSGGVIAPYVPDVNGDVSPEHYIQTVNAEGGTLIRILDHEGNLVFGPENMNYLWSDLGQTGLGDPVVLWDQDAERWLMTELSFDFSNMLVALSVTSDPLGEWYVYEFQGFELPDYPKWAIYPQAYMVVTNEPGQTDIPVYVMDKAAMLNGESDVEVQIFGVQRYGISGFEFANPADWNGNTLPPAEGPMYVVRMFDDSWGEGQDRIDLYEVFVDWDDPNESYINGPIEIPTAPFESQVCEFDAFSCFLQPDGTYMEGIESTIMHRSNYRNFGTYEDIVLNFIVDASDNNDDRSGIRWMELRKPSGGTWSVYQEGTYAPDLELHRWMPSINMDGNGSICMVYSVMGDDKFPSLRFTGRRSSDVLGQMTVEENEIGIGGNWNPINRWGDYFSVSVDPFDDRTFWITGEYQGEENWGTKIAKLMIRRDTNDIGPLDLLTPSNSGYLTNAETITATYKNYGYAAQSDFEAGVIFENEPSQVVSVTTELMPDSSIAIVFPSPVNMEVIGSYNFKLFTSMVGDENPNNDTIDVIVRKLPRFDAAIETIEGLADAVCNDEVTVGIELKNYGVENLTSADISWQLNGNPVNVINWTGNLPFLASEIINVTLNTTNGLIDSDNILIVSSSNPNLMVDEVPANDQLSRSFVVVLDGGAISLQVLTDGYPTETSWDIADMDGNVIFESDLYTEGQTLYSFEMCLDPDQCYTLNLYDSFGDGIQFGGIEGDVQIVDEEGQIIFDLVEPDYGSFAAFPFCATFQCILSLSGTASKATNATTPDGIIILEASNGFGPFQYSINNGVSFQPDAVFTGLLPGIYQCMVTDLNNCVSTLTLEVLACAVQNTYTVTSPDEGQSNGSVVINASGGIEPYKYSKNGGISYSSNNTFANLAAGVYIFCAKDFENCRKCDTLELAPLVGTYNLHTGVKIIVSPNPTDGLLQLELFGFEGGANEIFTTIHDATGKITGHQSMTKFGDMYKGFYNLRTYPAGIYYIWIKNGEVNELVKVVKI